MPHSRSRLRLKLWRLLAACAALAFVLPAGAQDTIDSLRDQREEAQEEREALLAKIETLKRVELHEAERVLEEIEAEIEDQEGRVADGRRALSDAENEVLLRDQAAAAAAAEITLTEAAIRVRMVDAYVGSAVPPEDWLSSGDLTETAVKQTLLEFAAGSERELLDRLRSQRAALETHLVAGQEARAEADRLLAQLNEDLAELEERKQLQQRAIDEIRVRIGDYDARALALQRESEDITDLILEKQAALADVPPESRKGFRRPLTGGWVSSRFGPRVHPIFGGTRLHAGIDFAAPTGTPIWASKAGRVISVGSRTGYGNTIIIDHEGPVATLYAHLSAFAVRTGDWVGSGELIGRVGNTGWSTGPHLHFEVRVNGQPKDPELFIDA